MIAVWVIIGIVVVLLFYFVFIFNGLVRLRNQVKNAWAQIDVQGYMQFERATLEAVTKARNVAQQAVGQGVGAQAKAEGELSGALTRLLAVVERYPDLKANQNFLALQEQLTSTENKISFSRQFYNDSVLNYNNKTQMLPSNIVAGMTGFKHGEFFEVKEAEEREVPKVSFEQPKT